MTPQAALPKLRQRGLFAISGPPRPAITLQNGLICVLTSPLPARIIRTEGIV